MGTLLKAIGMIALLAGGSALTLWLAFINAALAWPALVVFAALALGGIAAIARNT